MTAPRHEWNGLWKDAVGALVDRRIGATRRMPWPEGVTRLQIAARLHNAARQIGIRVGCVSDKRARVTYIVRLSDE